MNKIVGIFVISIVLVSAGLFFFQKQQNASTSQTVSSTQQTQGISSEQKTTDTTKTYTLKDVADHADRASCWTAINGKVYDLTSFVSQHPGGPFRILSICGKDGSAEFNSQHGGQARPANELNSLYIGDLSS